MSDAASKVQLPSVALILYGGMGVLGSVANLMRQLIRMLGPMVEAMIDGATPFELALIGAVDVFVLCWTASGIVTSGLIVLAGIKLNDLSSPGLIYLGTILAMVPMCSGSVPFIPVPCCCLGSILGVWVLVTLQDPEVQAALVE